MIVSIKSVNITGPGAGAWDRIYVVTSVSVVMNTKGIKTMKRKWTDILIEMILWAIVWCFIFTGCLLTYILK